MKKTIGAMSLGLGLITASGYWGWNEWRLHGLARDVERAASVLGSASHPSDAIFSLTHIAAEVDRTSMPPFHGRYSVIRAKAAQTLTAAPRAVATWIGTERTQVWNIIGSETQPSNGLEDRTVNDLARGLQGLAQEGLKAQDALANAATTLRVDPRALTGVDRIAAETATTARQANGIAEVVRQTRHVRANALSQVQQGLRQIDAANEEIERFADVPTLRDACYKWEQAESTIQSAGSTLQALPPFPFDYQRRVASSLLVSDRVKIDQILNQIGPHVRRAQSELATAERQESTVVGSAVRGLARMFDRAGQRAAESKVGKELLLSGKTLILGTKFLYDVMNMDANTDFVSWAARYEQDMNQLTVEASEIQRMDGWSITGKNTFVEGLVNSAYEKSFPRKR